MENLLFWTLSNIRLLQIQSWVLNDYRLIFYRWPWNIFRFYSVLFLRLPVWWLSFARVPQTVSIFVPSLGRLLKLRDHLNFDSSYTSLTCSLCFFFRKCKNFVTTWDDDGKEGQTKFLPQKSFEKILAKDYYSKWFLCLQDPLSKRGSWMDLCLHFSLLESHWSKMSKKILVTCFINFSQWMKPNNRRSISDFSSKTLN